MRDALGIRDRDPPPVGGGGELRLSAYLALPPTGGPREGVASLTGLRPFPLRGGANP